jgi:hypothetical protein
LDDLGFHALLLEVAFRELRVGGRDADAGEVLQAGVRTLLGEGDAEAAATEIERALDFVTAGGADAAAFEGGFFEDVLANDAEVAHAVHDELGDVVVADEKDIDGKVIRVEEQFLLGRFHLDAARLEEVEGVGGEAATFLNGEAEAVFREGGGHGGRELRVRGKVRVKGRVKMRAEVKVRVKVKSGMGKKQNPREVCTCRGFGNWIPSTTGKALRAFPGGKG